MVEIEAAPEVNGRTGPSGKTENRRGGCVTKKGRIEMNLHIILPQQRLAPKKRASQPQFDPFSGDFKL